MELNGWASPQMLEWYGGSARGARARRSYDRIMDQLTGAAGRPAPAGRARRCGRSRPRSRRVRAGAARSW